MPKNITTGYISHFCNYAHDQINEVYEAMHDEDDAKVIGLLTNLKKFINETVGDYKSELESKKAEGSNIDPVCSDRDGRNIPNRDSE
jgi:hypothetical protein